MWQWIVERVMNLLGLPLIADDPTPPVLPEPDAGRASHDETPTGIGTTTIAPPNLNNRKVE